LKPALSTDYFESSYEGDYRHHTLLPTFLKVNTEIIEGFSSISILDMPGVEFLATKYEEVEYEGNIQNKKEYKRTIGNNCQEILDKIIDGVNWHEKKALPEFIDVSQEGFQKDIKSTRKDDKYAISALIYVIRPENLIKTNVGYLWNTYGILQCDRLSATKSYLLRKDIPMFLVVTHKDKFCGKKQEESIIKKSAEYNSSKNRCYFLDLRNPRTATNEVKLILQNI